MKNSLKEKSLKSIQKSQDKIISNKMTPQKSSQKPDYVSSNCIDTLSYQNYSSEYNYLLDREFGIKQTTKSNTSSMQINYDNFNERSYYKNKSNKYLRTNSRFENFFKYNKTSKYDLLMNKLNIDRKSKSCNILIMIENPFIEFINKDIQYFDKGNSMKKLMVYEKLIDEDQLHSTQNDWLRSSKYLKYESILEKYIHKNLVSENLKNISDNYYLNSDINLDIHNTELNNFKDELSMYFTKTALSKYLNEPFYRFLLKKSSKIKLMHFFKYLSYEIILEINNFLLKSINLILNDNETLEVMIFFYINANNEISKHFIFSMDIEGLALSSNVKNLIRFLTNIKTEEEKDFIYKQVVKINTFIKLIYDKNGKNLIEFIIDFFYNENEFYKISSLSIIIENRFLEFSISNFSTFVIQKYIRKHKPSSVLDTIIIDIDTIGFNRNGIFIIIACLESFDRKQTTTLVEKIIDRTEIFYKEKYCSTLLEYIFFSFDISIDYFIMKKSKYLLGKFIKNKNI